MNGVVESLHGTYGFIRGEDRVSYFFIPTGMQQTQTITFADVQVGMRARFTHIDHPRGPRAIEVLITGNGDCDRPVTAAVSDQPS